MITEELIPISQAEIDIERAAERLHIGPQGRLMEKIDRFNNLYYTNIGVNKNYGFKPGAYDEVKKVFINKMLRFNMKPSNMFSLKKRIDDNSWSQRNYWNTIIEIQNMMYRLKRDQVGWQDNTEILKTYWDSFKERIPNEIANMLAAYPGHSMNIDLEANKLLNEDNWADLKIIITLFTPDIELEVYHQDEIISKTPWGHVETKWFIPFWKYLNHFCQDNPALHRHTSIANPHAKIYPFHEGVSHPYVSKTPYAIANGWSTYTCTGDMQNDITNAAWNIDIMGLTLLTKFWLERYHIPRTNPLNRIDKCLYGWQKGSDKKIWKHRTDHSMNVIDECKWPDRYVTLLSRDDDIDEIVNACDTCYLKDGYAELINNSAIPEDSEYPGQEVIAYEPCYKALQDYSIPETEDDCIIEAGIFQLMVYEQRVGTLMPVDEIDRLDINRSYENPMPVNYNLELVLRYIENFSIKIKFLEFKNRFSNYEVIDVLDKLFMGDLFNMAIEEYCETFDVHNENEREDVYYDFRHASIREVNAYSRERFISENELNNVNNQLFQTENLTPEERAIRWATQNGRTINI